MSTLIQGGWDCGLGICIFLIGFPRLLVENQSAIPQIVNCYNMALFDLFSGSQRNIADSDSSF
jgi:hypothetical protein